MNEHTAKVLDYDLIRDELRTYTVTPMGKILAQQLQPHTDTALLDIQLRETSEMTALLAAGDDPPLAPVADLRIYVEAAQLAGYYLEGQQFLEVADCLEVLQQLRRFARHNSQRLPLLARRLAPLSDFSIFLRQIRSAIDERGAIRDSASPLLQEIRKTLRHTGERIHRTLLEVDGHARFGGTGCCRDDPQRPFCCAAEDGFPTSPTRYCARGVGQRCHRIRRTGQRGEPQQ